MYFLVCAYGTRVCVGVLHGILVCCVVMLRVACCVLHLACCVLCVACWALVLIVDCWCLCVCMLGCVHVRHMTYISCVYRVLRVASCVLFIACCVLCAVCCVLCGVCCLLCVARCVFLFVCMHVWVCCMLYARV